MIKELRGTWPMNKNRLEFLLHYAEVCAVYIPFPSLQAGVACVLVGEHAQSLMAQARRVWSRFLNFELWQTVTPPLLFGKP